jgi:16S rRNA processing protein RimM
VRGFGSRSRLSSSTTPLILFAQLGKPHGLHGATFARPYNDASPLWRSGASLLLLPASHVGNNAQNIVAVPNNVVKGLVQATITETFQTPKGHRVLKLDVSRRRESAEALRGTYLVITESQLAELPVADDEFWFHEVPGWEVALGDGTVVGTVVRAIETHVEMLEVRPKAGGPTFFIPVVASIVTRISRAEKRFELDPPDGLIP